MAENVYSEPDIIKKVPCDQKYEESIVDIYVSTESLRVYDNPWVENVSQNLPSPAEAQHPASLRIPKNVSEHAGKRNKFSAYLVLLGAVCLFLVIGIICIGVKLNIHKAKWDAERNQLVAAEADLRITVDELLFNNTRLSEQIDSLWNRFCRRNPRRCQNLV